MIYTGPNPDKYRDYNIDKVYPEIIEAMSLESKRLYKVVDDMVLYTGQKADKIATAQTLAQQLERFVDRPEKITLEFSPTFKDNITALGTAILNMSETKLDVDYLVVTGKNAKPEKDSANGFDKAVHELRSFAASFYVDYDAVGDVYDKDSDDVVSVWVLVGRGLPMEFVRDSYLYFLVKDESRVFIQEKIDGFMKEVMKNSKRK